MVPVSRTPVGANAAEFGRQQIGAAITWHERRDALFIPICGRCRSTSGLEAAYTRRFAVSLSPPPQSESRASCRKASHAVMSFLVISLMDQFLAMLFKSRHDEDTTATQELIVFCHAQERVLLPLPKTFKVCDILLLGLRCHCGGVRRNTSPHCKGISVSAPMQKRRQGLGMIGPLWSGFRQDGDFEKGRSKLVKAP